MYKTRTHLHIKVGGSVFSASKKYIEIGLRHYLDATIDWLSVYLSAVVVVQRKIDATTGGNKGNPDGDRKKPRQDWKDA